MTGESTARPVGARFGFRLAGVPLLVPAETRALFLPAAGVDPMPLAPARLRGFTQRHGRAVPVFDAAAAAPSMLPVRTRRPLLVFDGSPESAALLVEEAPERLLGPLTEAPMTPLPAVPWADACVGACVDAAGHAWWAVDLRRLFGSLAQA